MVGTKKLCFLGEESFLLFWAQALLGLGPFLGPGPFGPGLFWARALLGAGLEQGARDKGQGAKGKEPGARGKGPGPGEMDQGQRARGQRPGAGPTVLSKKHPMAQQAKASRVTQGLGWAWVWPDCIFETILSRPQWARVLQIATRLYFEAILPRLDEGAHAANRHHSLLLIEPNATGRHLLVHEVDGPRFLNLL